MKKIKIGIFKYHQSFFTSEEVKSVSFYAEGKGAMTVLFDHMPVIASIKDSVVIVSLLSGEQKVKKFWIQKGIFYFQKNQIKLIADELKEKL